MVLSAFVIVACTAASAQAQKVVILAAEDPSVSADVHDKLLATGKVTQVDVIDVRATTPTLATLLQYDAALVWSDFDYADPAALGNVLADYVDQGHGVVEAVFDFAAGMPTVTLGGRWRSGNYAALTLGGFNLAAMSLVADQPGHAILQGVTRVSTGPSGFYHAGSLPAPCAQLVAHWDNGEPLVVTCAGPSGGRVVGLNMYPPSSDVQPDNWLADSDGAILMANALVHAGTAPTNTAPSVDAGADQVHEATAAGFLPFTLHASATDVDGDALTFSWSGPVSGDGATLTGVLPLPAAPAKTQTYTFTVTAVDGHGGMTSDVVLVTVGDTTAPVLVNMPTGVLTAQATSAAGASVPYGPVTAQDAVEGARPVTCNPAGPVFPVGDTTVTCSAFDSRGNTVTASFIVRVTNGTVTPGLMYGAGVVRQGTFNYQFEFLVRESASGNDRVSLSLRVVGGRSWHDDRFEAKTVDSVVFTTDPSLRYRRSAPQQMDSVVFRGLGEWNGHAGYRYDAFAVDSQGSSGRCDAVRIVITAPNGTVVASVDGALTLGRVESARLRR